MSAYVISMRTVNDAESYAKYTERTPPIVKKYGGKFLTRGETFSCPEGQPYDGRLVILEFPSKADIDAWFSDPDYQEAMKFRHAASTMNYLLYKKEVSIRKTQIQNSNSTNELQGLKEIQIDIAVPTLSSEKFACQEYRYIRIKPETQEFNSGSPHFKRIYHDRNHCSFTP